MRDDVGEIIAPERAALAAHLPAEAEHEMINDELAPPGEQVGERLLAVRPVEHVALLDPLPRQLAPLPAQVVTHPVELLLLGEQRLARLEPLRRRDDFVAGHRIPPPL